MILDGNAIAERIMDELSSRSKAIMEKSGVQPRLDLILVGKDSAAKIYASAKMRRAKKIGCTVTLTELPDDTTMDEISTTIEEKAADSDIHGIMVESPVPRSLSYQDIVDMIPYMKDVDGTGSMNQGLIVSRREFMTPATPAAVVEILGSYSIFGSVTIVNRSAVVGRPLAGMLLNRDFTVTICHSRTPEIRRFTQSSDVVVVAVGRPSFFDRSYFRENSYVIDVGINYVEDKVVGDVNYDDVFPHVKGITPVPGGVGPVTATLIFKNLLKTAEIQISGHGKDS